MKDAILLSIAVAIAAPVGLLLLCGFAAAWLLIAFMDWAYGTVTGKPTMGAL